MKLDKTKPFGVIGGHPTYRYEQNGKYFDVNFNEIVPEPVVQLSKSPDKPSKSK